MKKWFTKSMFLFGVIMLSLIVMAYLINMTDLKWLICYDSSFLSEVDHCRIFPSFLVPAIFLLLASLALQFLQFDSMITKKKVLIISLLYPIFFALIIVLSIVCSNDKWCDTREDGINGLIIFGFFPLVFILFFSLLTYRMRNEVFEHWMKFGRWGIPVLFFINFLLFDAPISNGLGGIGGVMGKAFVAMLLVILYGTFCIISLWRILSKYKQLKRGK
jgi:hypothetical protein